MKKLLVSIVALGFSTAAMAQAATDFASVDTDTSGDISLTEAQVVWPDLTEDAYKAADIDQSGSLSQEEYDAYLAANPPAAAQ
ncbi:MAG: EF-hand domain-containing protein [Devosia sp.]